MDEVSFKLRSALDFSHAYTIEWHDFDNTMQITFEDTNKMYKMVDAMIKNQTRFTALIEVLHADKMVRYYQLALLPLKIAGQTLHSDGYLSSLTVTFKIISSDLVFIGDDE